MVNEDAQTGSRLLQGGDMKDRRALVARQVEHNHNSRTKKMRNVIKDGNIQNIKDEKFQTVNHLRGDACKGASDKMCLKIIHAGKK